MNIRNKAWMSFLSMMLAVSMLFSPTAAMAQEGESHAEQEESSKIDMTSLILDHISDSYEWHFCGEGENAVAIPLPVFVYSKVRGEWFFFSFKHIEEAEHHHTTYEGFKLAEEGEAYEGKIVELNPATGEWERPLDLSLTKNAVGLFLNSIILICIVMYLRVALD